MHNSYRRNKVSITKRTIHLKALLSLTIISKHDIFQLLGEFFDFTQTIVDIGDLLQDFIFLCSEQSNLNVGWFVHTVHLDCYTHPPHIICWNFINSIRNYSQIYIVFLFFMSKKNRKKKHLITSQKNCTDFFDKKRKVFQNFSKNVESVSLFLQKVLKSVIFSLSKSPKSFSLF